MKTYPRKAAIEAAEGILRHASRRGVVLNQFMLEEIIQGAIDNSHDELVAALEKVEAYLGDFCDQGILDNHPAHKLWTDVQAALHNARGE